MKKTILSCLCLLVAATGMAQNNQNRSMSERQNQRVQMNGGQRQMPMQQQPVLDENILASVGVDSVTLAKAKELAAAADIKVERKLDEQGKPIRPSREEMQEVANKRRAAVAAMRKQLRELIGDDKYIVYLERVIDRSGARQPGFGPNAGNGPRRMR